MPALWSMDVVAYHCYRRGRIRQLATISMFLRKLAYIRVLPATGFIYRRGRIFDRGHYSVSSISLPHSRHTGRARSIRSYYNDMSVAVLP